jgi:hypothetical protein
MRRKNRKWVALTVGLYLLLMYSAVRWAINQREPEGNIFNRIEHEGIKRLAEEKAKASGNDPKPTGDTRLNAAGPAFVAARYDRTHVVFMVVTDTESRFSDSHRWRLSTVPIKLPLPSVPAAPLAALQELYEPDSQSLHFFPEIIQKTPPGEQWNLALSSVRPIPALIERPVIAPLGCSLALGFLAAIAPEQQAAFVSAQNDYFAIRRAPVQSADPPVDSHIAELRWKLSPATARQIEQQLIARMKQEVTRIDASFLVNAASPGEAAGELPNNGARPHLKEWIHADQGLMRGEGRLDYDTHAYRLTPDQAPRILVRGRWTLSGATVFLMTAWFKEEAAPSDSVAIPQLTLLFADSGWSTALRETDHTGTLGETLDFQSVLNELDADHDGWAELLIHSTDLHPDQGASSAITLYSYSDKGLIPLKSPFRRTTESTESCLDR